jgi:hypothetical protein
MPTVPWRAKFTRSLMRRSAIACYITEVTPILTAVFGLFLLLGYVVGTAVLAHWMLEPINRAGGHLRASTRFLLTDVFGLMALLQVALALCGAALDATDARADAAYWILISVSALLAFVLWAASVSVVSRAGILGPLKRLTVIVLLIPGTLAVVMSLPILAIGLVTGWQQFVGPHWPFHAGPAAVVGLVVVVAMIFVIRRLSFWALTASTPATPVGPPYSENLWQGPLRQ